MPWVIVLAGGSGSRLASEAERRYGYARPKQYCDFGAGTLLDQTLARARRVAPDRRILVVTTRAHRREADEVLGRYPRITRLEQPSNRDTTHGLLWPLLFVRAHDAAGKLVVLPSDHAVADEGLLAKTLHRAVGVVGQEPRRMVVLGSEVHGPDDGYGWIVPARAADAGPADTQGVARFREKPPRPELDALRAEGALANTFMLASRVETLARAFAELTPETWRALSSVGPSPSAELERAFEASPPSSFSHAVLERMPERLRLLKLPGGVGWSDIGTPQRLADAHRERRTSRASAPQPSS